MASGVADWRDRLRVGGLIIRTTSGLAADRDGAPQATGVRCELFRSRDVTARGVPAAWTVGPGNRLRPACRPSEGNQPTVPPGRCTIWGQSSGESAQLVSSSVGGRFAPDETAQQPQFTPGQTEDRPYLVGVGALQVPSGQRRDLGQVTGGDGLVTGDHILYSSGRIRRSPERSCAFSVIPSAWQSHLMIQQGRRLDSSTRS